MSCSSGSESETGSAAQSSQTTGGRSTEDYDVTLSADVSSVTRHSLLADEDMDPNLAVSSNKTVPLHDDQSALHNDAPAMQDDAPAMQGDAPAMQDDAPASHYDVSAVVSQEETIRADRKPMINRIIKQLGIDNQ